MLYKEIYTLRKLEVQDLPAVKDLFWKVFQKKVSIEYLKNKYNTSYLGVEYICSIAFYKEKPVAFYGAIPQKFTSKKESFYVAHACDSFTLKEYQGQGLHYNLALIAYEIMKSHAIKFVYAFHSENTYYSTKKLDWKEYVNLHRYHLFIKTVPLAKVLNKIGYNSFYSLFYSKKISTEGLSQLNISDTALFHQKFDTEFITYKNKMTNHFFIKIDNCIFWIKIEAIMHVGIFKAPSASTLFKALKKIKRKAFILGINEILFQVHPDTLMSEQLNTHITAKASWLVGYLLFDTTVLIDNFRFNYSNLDTY